MINRITIRPACINAFKVCLGSVDKLQHGKLGEVQCCAERLQTYNSGSFYTVETHLQSI